MTPEQEKNMRAQIAELPTSELIDLAIELQTTVDTHYHEKTGLRDSIKQLQRQNEALQVAGQESPEIAEASAKEMAALEKRCQDLQELNEGLQKKLLAS